MTKFKKQMIFAVLLIVAAIALTVTYFLVSKEDVAAPAPVVDAILDGENIVISGLDPEKSYEYSRDNKKWQDAEKNVSQLTLDVGKMCYIREKGDNNASAVVGAFGESTKNSRPYIVDMIENKDMNSIFVHNPLGEYTLIHKKSGAYKIEGLDGFEVDEEKLASLRVNAMNLLALRYVDRVSDEELLGYGIDVNNPASYFTVTYNETDSYTILVGDKTPDGDGYYAVLQGRGALYVVDTGLESSILSAKRDYVKPAIVHTVEQSHKFTLSTFTLNKKGEKFVTIDKVSGDLTYGNNSTHRVTFPAYNYATNLTNFEVFLNDLLALTGSKTLLYGDEITDEALRAYGFFDADGNDTSDYSFSYKFPAFSEELWVMKDAETGDYIAYSKNAGIVASVPAASLAFLEWDMLLWVSSEIYLLDIEDIAKMTFEGNGEKAEFVLSGEAQDLSVKVNGKVGNIEDFKQLYKSILYIIVTSYSDGSAVGEEALHLTVETEKGEVLDYRFYRHTAQNMYYTLNGFGEFYVSADKVNEVKETAFGFIY
ncbi:MAG: DUF4340 domain-containing protein [Clostridia bacterium]|nr:DUF4340 domain-containing protein [Clostridia bacterium]